MELNKIGDIVHRIMKIMLQSLESLENINQSLEGYPCKCNCNEQWN